MSVLWLKKRGVGQSNAHDWLFEIAAQLNFVIPQDDSDTESVAYSKWWKRDSGVVGAATIAGDYQGKPAVLKLQFAKIAAPEQRLIREFRSRSEGLAIRPPEVYFSADRGVLGPFEVIIMESVSETVVPDDGIATQAVVNDFFKAYLEYRKVVNHPFISSRVKLAKTLINKSFQNWIQIRQQLDTQKLISLSDKKLIDAAVGHMIDTYDKTQVEFCHGHFSARDVRRQGNMWVVLSNLYWSYRVPMYDLVFAWHWRRLDLVSRPGLGIPAVEAEQPLWEAWMQQAVSSVAKHHNNPTLLYRLARLERATAGLNLDILAMPADRQNEQCWLMDRLREEINLSLV